MEFCKKRIYSPVRITISAFKSVFGNLFDLGAESTGRFLRYFLRSSRYGYRLPNNVILLLILIINVLVLSFATYTVLNEVDKKLSVWNNRLVLFDESKKNSKPPKKKNFILLDDFGKVSQNRIGGNIAAINGYGGSCSYAIIVPPSEPQRELEISYNVYSPSSYCGYLTELNGIDLSKYRILAFQIKGETADEVFKIELGDGRLVSSIALSRILPDGLSEQWQKVLIPLSSFSSIKDWGNMEGGLTILFEHCQGMPYKGTIYIRDIRFLKNTD